MRRLLFPLAICLAAAPMALADKARADDLRPSQIVCDSKKIGARELADCLRAAADKSEKDLAAVIDAAAKSIDTRVGLLSAQKARWKRSLNESEAQWLGWRDTDCQDVAPFEAGMSAKGGDPRLACIIDHDAQRIAEMKARYP
ncbi:lysozyme inhibitor LprI family protein [Methylocapsa sp. S129]|uniref:lysozyme inhibitor LprI family protein n=1 Tax=Methylocapsa sp. S129 TaxID=1641869 RepID=UPI00131B7424|nr:lysozyme inhibitor LprI family protein [Methylocapsa sp. S129]